jgi:hypothetical protein
MGEAMREGLKQPPKIAFWVAPGIVGGIVIGIVAGTDLSPAVAGLLGAVLISVTMVVMLRVVGE